MRFFAFLVTDALSNDIKVFHNCWIRNFDDWSRWEQHQLKGLITLSKYIFRHRFLFVFGHVFDALSNGIKLFHICQLGNFGDWSPLERRQIECPITLDRCIFRHRFLCVFCHIFDTLSNGIKVFHICRLWFWGNFWARFGPVLLHFQLLRRLQPCYTADCWYVHDSEMLKIKIVTSSDMGL